MIAVGRCVIIAAVTGQFLSDHFLIAMPSLADPNFARGVTYLVQHTKEGAMGLVINRQSNLCVADMLNQLDIDCDSEELLREPVLVGGPVQSERGFVLHTGEEEWEATFRVTEQLAVTTSRDVLEALASGQGPERSLIALGCAGWEGGQLEAEMRENSWLSTPAREDIIFDAPLEQRWERAAASLGVAISALGPHAGRA